MADKRKTTDSAATVQWGRSQFTESEIQRQITQATKRGEERLRRDPLATAVRYHKPDRSVVIETNKGVTLTISVDRLQGLHDASDRDLSKVEILGPGVAIEWPTLDQQFSITGLLSGVFGNETWISDLRRRDKVAKPTVATKMKTAKPREAKPATRRTVLAKTASR